MKKLCLPVVIFAVFVLSVSSAHAWQIKKDRRDGYRPKAVDIVCNNGSEHTILYLPDSCSSKPYSYGLIATCDYASLSEAAERVCSE